MGIDDITKKAQDLLGSQKAQDALKSDKAEGISDKLLDGLANAADKVTGGKFDAQIDGARDAADKGIGTDEHTVSDKPLRTEGGDTDKPLPDR